MHNCLPAIGCRVTTFAFGLAVLMQAEVWVHPAHATELITNGGFEAGGGSLAGWTEIPFAPGFTDIVVQSGTTTPTFGFPAPAPPDPTHAAMFGDCACEAAGVLYQKFAVPTGFTAATLSYQIAVLNRYVAFYSPPTLDPTVFDTDDIPNQQARVDILVANPSNEFSVGPADVLLNVFQTQPGDPSAGLFSQGSYTLQTTDLTAFLHAHEGQTLQLRFAAANSFPYLQLGVDAVSLSVATPAAVPEPASLALLGTGLLVFAGIRRRQSPLRRLEREAPL
jgi:hypothetical protein